MMAMHFKKKMDLIFSMSLWKEFRLLQILNDLSIKHLIKRCNILQIQEKFRIDWFVICLKWETFFIDTWSYTSIKAMKWLICFSMVNLMLRCLLLKKIEKFNESCSFSKVARISSTYFNKNLGLLRLYSLNYLYL